MPCTRSAGLYYHDDARLAVAFETDGDQVRIRFSEGALEAVGRRIVWS
jgi:hypothetical protein